MGEKKLADFPGAKIIELRRHDDDRGYFLEVLRESWVKTPIKQISVSMTNPGVIKAFHWHKKQQDIWYLVSGKVLVVLHDLRENSPNYKKTRAFTVDSGKNPKLIIIPIKVAHGYKVLGNAPVTMLYAMDNEYDPKNPDEERIPHDDIEIGFDWDSDAEEL